MQIYLTAKYLVDGDVRSVEMYDLNAKVGLGTVDVNSASREPFDVLADEAGFGNVKRRNLTNNGPWVEANFLHEGDEIDTP